MATPANSVATTVTELAPQRQATTAVAGVVFETNRWPYLLTLPISWALTLWVIGKKLICQLLGRKGLETNTFWFDGLGPLCRKIKDGAASWRALDVIYNWHL